METLQHGNGPKSDFGSVSFFFQELSEIPEKRKSVEVFPNIFYPFSLYLHLIRFPFFYRSPHFFSPFLGLKKVLNSQFVNQFPFLRYVSLFFGVRFRFSKKF